MFDPSKIQHVYIACGYTDLRRGIDGLVNIVQNSFQLDPFANALFVFYAYIYMDEGSYMDAPVISS